ncbi:hypothetical protein BDV11DRAFT_179270 [Aspergillus similis]
MPTSSNDCLKQKNTHHIMGSGVLIEQKLSVGKQRGLLVLIVVNKSASAKSVDMHPSLTWAYLLVNSMTAHALHLSLAAITAFSLYVKMMEYS